MNEKGDPAKANRVGRLENGHAGEGWRARRIGRRGVGAFLPVYEQGISGE